MIAGENEAISTQHVRAMWKAIGRGSKRGPEVGTRRGVGNSGEGGNRGERKACKSHSATHADGMDSCCLTSPRVRNVHGRHAMFSCSLFHLVCLKFPERSRRSGEPASTRCVHDGSQRPVVASPSRLRKELGRRRSRSEDVDVAS
eukprot:scaffold132406_cov27-Tisochrysis_lutea.AAC.2